MSIMSGGTRISAAISPAPGVTSRIFGFHVCDWLVPTEDVLNDRGMMGDGVIDIRAIRGAVEAAGYAGLVEAEIFSALDWWQRPIEETLSICRAGSRPHADCGVARKIAQFVVRHGDRSADGDMRTSHHRDPKGIQGAPWGSFTPVGEVRAGARK